MKEDTKGKNKKRLVVGVSVVCVFIILLGIGYFILNTPQELTVKDNLEIEVGVDVVPTVQDYFNENLKYPSQYKVEYSLTSYTKNAEAKGDGLDKETINGKEVAVLMGTYDVTITNEKFNKEYHSTLKVIDTTTPEYIVKDVALKKNEKYSIDDFVAECSDNSGMECILSYVDSDNKPSTSEIGEYDIDIEISDSSENKAIETVKLTVVETEEEANKLEDKINEEVEEKKEENSTKNNSSTNTSNKTSGSNKNNSSTNNKNSTSNKSITSNKNNSSNSNSSGSGSTTPKEDPKPSTPTKTQKEIDEENFAKEVAELKRDGVKVDATTTAEKDKIWNKWMNLGYAVGASPYGCTTYKTLGEKCYYEIDVGVPKGRLTECKAPNDKSKLKFNDLGSLMYDNWRSGKEMTYLEFMITKGYDCTGVYDVYLDKTW